MHDSNNDYSHAGPGAKRRKAIRLENIPTARPSKKTKPVRERLTTEYRDVSGLELKSRILALTLDGLDPRQIDEALRQENIRATLVTISNVHRLYRETIKLLRGMGLINETRLNRYLARE